MTTPVLEIHELNAFYGDLRIVQELSLLHEGGITSIIGRNGMGKTTLIKAIMGLVKRSGSIKFFGEEIVTLKPHQIARLGIGYVPQGRRNFPSLTVDESLTFCAQEGYSEGSGQKWTKERVYEVFPHIYKRKSLMSTSLSGGEQQMLAIGRALVLNPRLLIMDEPSEGLAPTVIDILVDFFEKIKHEGIHILLVEQDLNFCGRVADRTNVINIGKTAYRGSLSELRQDKTLSQQLLGIG